MELEILFGTATPIPFEDRPFMVSLPGVYDQWACHNVASE